MYRVLMPVDDNTERAMAQARHVADIPNASDSVEVTILYVFEDEDSLDPSNDEAARKPENVESVARVVEFFETNDITHETRKDRGNPSEAILVQAEELEPNAIVLGGRKRSPAGKILFGSVTMDVLRNTDIPVVVSGTARRD